MNRRLSRAAPWVAAAALATAPLAAAQQHRHDPSMHQHAIPQGAPGADGRVEVDFPPPLKEHTLANMRDHLTTLLGIQDHLARHEYDQAAALAEQRLGMSSLDLHGAHEVAPYMPKGMQDAGTAMHRSASRFAVSLQEAAIDRDLSKPLAALADVTRACVACHAGYRLK